MKKGMMRAMFILGLGVAFLYSASFAYADGGSFTLFSTVPSAMASYDQIKIVPAVHPIGTDCTSDGVGTIYTDSNGNLLKCGSAKKIEDIDNVWTFDSASQLVNLKSGVLNYKLGIGTSSPGAILDIYKNSAGYSAPMLLVNNPAVGAVPRLRLQSADGTGVNKYADIFWSAGDYSLNLSNHDTFGNSGINFLTSAGQKMVIHNDGNVGIGTTAPTQTLNVLNASFIQGEFSSSTSSGGIKLTPYAGGHSWEFQAIASDSSPANSLIVYDRGAAAYRMMINSSGNVGIGTTAPRGGFDLAGTGDVYLANNTVAGPAAVQSIYLPGHIYIAPLNNSSNVSYLQARRSDNSGSTELQVRTYNAGTLVDAMRISSLGNVGIGTTMPQNQLHIHNPNSAGLRLSGLNNNSGSNYNGIIFANSETSINNAWLLNQISCVGGNAVDKQHIDGGFVFQKWANASGNPVANTLLLDNLGNIGMRMGEGGPNYPDTNFHINMIRDYTGITLSNANNPYGVAGASNFQSGIRFKAYEPATFGYWMGRTGYDFQFGYESTNQLTTPNIAAAPIMSFKHNNGSGVWDVVGIGTLAPFGPYKLYVQGNINAQGAFYSWGGWVASDMRLKKDVQTVPNALQRVTQLRGVNYKWIDEARGKETQMGVIAQEVEKVFPEVVQTDAQGFKSVAYQNMVGALIEAVKELNVKVDKLSKENEELKKKMVK
ncbi:MAG: tail fiber domain-containing protein [Candidatus Omnitrophica bacterium]|nr:tail fiber domain-containing protein [Candidatus Omnitrophota bacterium]